MATATPDSPTPTPTPPRSPALSPSLANLYHCHNCGSTYDWRKSTSALKMTWCNTLCEYSELGTTIETLLRWHPVPRRTESITQ